MERKAVLITGSNGGVGIALCREFASAGFLVVASDRAERSECTCDNYLSLDLEELVQNAAEQERFRKRVRGYLERSGAGLAGLINNAATQILGTLDSVDMKAFESSQRVNLGAPFLLAKLFAEDLRRAQGSIVNIGSIHSRLTKRGFCAYSISKAGLAGLTRALALEFAGDVTVNTVSPAAVDTPMLQAGFLSSPGMVDTLSEHHPVGRIGRPEEVARLAIYLTSAQARFITGADISMDGGIGIRLHDPN